MKVDISKVDYNTGNIPRDITIEKHDVICPHISLAFIIHPLLVEFKDKTKSAPRVDDEDVPQNMCQYHATYDKLVFDRWDYILDEMIYAFQMIIENEESDLGFEDWSKIQPRVSNGLRLFGKYYLDLWS